MASTMTGVITLVCTVKTQVNNSPNVTVANVNVNVNVASGGSWDVTDWQSFVSTIMAKGLWVGNQFYPASMITLITAIQG
jgi:hypothetical protein